VRQLDRRRSSPRALLLVALLASTLALRPQLTGVGPLLPEIQSDFHISHTSAGFLATIPILCMGVFALPAARVLRRFNVRSAIGTCLVAIAIATVSRALAPEFGLVLALTLPFGIAAGVMGALLPAVVKVRFSERPALGTGVFAFGLNVGASLGAGLAVPLAHQFGGWRWSLGLMAAAGAFAIPAWMALSRRSLLSVERITTHDPLPWHSAVAWAATLVFGFQALCFFGLNAWLADAMVERGWSDGAAGWLVAVLNLVALPGVLLVSLLAGRVIGVRPYLCLAAAGLLVGTVGLTAADGSAWAWVALISLSLGSLFALSMTLAVIVARRPGEAAAIAGMQLGVGYAMAATAPLALGALRDNTGGYDAGLWLVATIAVLVVASVVAAVALLESSARA
jgi:MFS transporter, CP family, cyanate transporter